MLPWSTVRWSSSPSYTVNHRVWIARHTSKEDMSSGSLQRKTSWPDAPCGGREDCAETMSPLVFFDSNGGSSCQVTVTLKRLGAAARCWEVLDCL